MLQCIANSPLNPETFRKYIEQVEGELRILKVQFNTNVDECFHLLRTLEGMTEEICRTKGHQEGMKLIHQIILILDQEKSAYIIDLLKAFPLNNLYVKAEDIRDCPIIGPIEDGFVSLDGIGLKGRFCLRVLKDPDEPSNENLEIHMDTPRCFELSRTREPSGKLVFTNIGMNQFEVEEVGRAGVTLGFIKKNRPYKIQEGDMVLMGDHTLKVISLDPQTLNMTIDGNAKAVTAGQVFSIGRDPSNVYPLDNPKLSKKHCKIYYNDQDWIIQDLGSTNGIWLAFHTIKTLGTQANSIRRVVENGDVLSFQRVTYRLEPSSKGQHSS